MVGALMFAINRQTWNSWSAADRELVRQAARDAAAEATALRVRQGGDAALGEAARQGTTVTCLTDAGKQAFRNATRPVHDQWAATIGTTGAPGGSSDGVGGSDALERAAVR